MWFFHLTKIFRPPQWRRRGFRIYGGAGWRRAFSHQGYTRPLAWSDGFRRKLKREDPLEIAYLGWSGADADRDSRPIRSVVNPSSASVRKQAVERLIPWVRFEADVIQLKAAREVSAIRTGND